MAWRGVKEIFHSRVFGCSFPCPVHASPSPVRPHLLSFILLLLESDRKQTRQPHGKPNNYTSGAIGLSGWLRWDETNRSFSRQPNVNTLTRIPRTLGTHNQRRAPWHAVVVDADDAAWSGWMSIHFRTACRHLCTLSSKTCFRIIQKCFQRCNLHRKDTKVWRSVCPRHFYRTNILVLETSVSLFFFFSSSI